MSRTWIRQVVLAAALILVGCSHAISPFADGDTASAFSARFARTLASTDYMTLRNELSPDLPGYVLTNVHNTLSSEGLTVSGAPTQSASFPVIVPPGCNAPCVQAEPTWIVPLVSPNGQKEQLAVQMTNSSGDWIVTYFAVEIAKSCPTWPNC